MADDSFLNDSIFDDSVASSHQHQHYPQDQQQEYSADDMGVLFQLIESRDWESVLTFCNQIPDAASVGRIYAEDVLNLPLHEVVKQPNPSMTVVNLLLNLYPEGTEKKGYQGNLPLHYACSNGAMPSNVIQQLLNAYPMATRVRNDDDALPIHLACQHLTELESIVCILQTHPEGCYLRDADGFTALDYLALDTNKLSIHSNGETTKATIELMAPILVETAKAASERKADETNAQIKGIQEAHAEYLRQLGEREEEAQNEMLQAQIDLQDQLSSEKERNIALAERILEKERKLQNLQNKVSQLANLVKDERLSRQLQTAKQLKEYKEILGIADGDGTRSGPLSPSKSPRSSSPSKVNHEEGIKQHLSSLVQRCANQQQKYTEMAKDLTYNANMVRNLNELLTTKEEQLAEITEENDTLKQKVKAQHEQNTTLQSTMETTQDELLDAKKEIQRLSQMYEKQSEQLVESNRIVRVQESRLASIKSLAQSLSFNIESWALDDQQKEEEETENWGHRQSESQFSQSRPSQSPQKDEQPRTPSSSQPLPPPQDEIVAQPTDEEHFEVLEGMEAVADHGNDESKQKAMPKTEDYSLKTSETGMSTRPEETLPPSPNRTESVRSTSTGHERPQIATRQVSELSQQQE